MTAPGLRTILVLCCGALLTSDAAGCSRAAATGAAAAAGRETFRGVYEAGPDRSAFLPCGSGEQWYVSTQSSQARELRRLTSTQDLQSPGGGLLPPERAKDIKRAYAEIEGDTVAVSPGGPTLAFQRELRLTRVLVVRPAQGGACP